MMYGYSNSSTTSSVIGTVGIEVGLSQGCILSDYSMRQLGVQLPCGTASVPYCSNGTIPWVTEPISLPTSSLDVNVSCTSCTAGRHAHIYHISMCISL